MPTKVLNDVVLSEFVELVLGPVVDETNIPPALAKQIAEVDKDESITHIEWPNKENELQRPRLWRIDAWRTSYKKHVHIKTLSAHERAVNVRASELRALLIKKLCAMTGLDAASVEKIAQAIIKTRNVKAAETFSLDIDELIAADAVLNNYKQSTGTK